MSSDQNRLLKDVVSIMKHPLTDNGIFYVHDETNMLKGYALIIGPIDTPYQHGFYFFEFDFPTNYPYAPPKVTYHTNDGKTRFNPNLYRNGKVCVSTLNTWRGEQWTACQSIRSILMTLVTLLNDNPLTNEPGFRDNHPACKPYRDIIEFMNYRIAICDILNKRHLPEMFYGFLPIITKYVIENKDIINSNLKKLKDSPVNNTKIQVGAYNMSLNVNYQSIIVDFELLIKELLIKEIN
jgi:ubiquitin-protein ligase